MDERSYDKTIEYLKGYREASRDLANAKLTLDELETKIINLPKPITPDTVKVKESKLYSDLSDLIVRYTDSWNQYIQAAENAMARMEEVRCTIEQVEDDRLRVILYDKYIGGHTLQEILDRKGAVLKITDYRWIQRLHRRSLEEIKIIKKF